jgi:hypothetical protein
MHKIKKTNDALAKVIFPKWKDREIGKAIIQKRTNALDDTTGKSTQGNKIQYKTINSRGEYVIKYYNHSHEEGEVK